MLLADEDAAEAAKQAILQAQAETARLQAEIDTAKCRIYASLGLDCEGKRPPMIVNGDEADRFR